MSASKTWLVALLFLSACSSGSKGDSGSGGSSGGGGATMTGGGGPSATGGTNAQGSGGKSGSRSGGECIAEGADCRQTSEACCEGLLCSQTEQTCLLKCSQNGECVAPFSQGRQGAKGMCCATQGYDPAQASTTGMVCGARCPP